MTTARPAAIMGIPVKAAPLGANRSDGNFLGATICAIHDIEGSAASALGFFATPGPPGGGGSTQFIADPLSGCFWQLVSCDKVAYGVGNYDYNQRALQLELPGYAGRPFDPNVVDYAARFIAWCKTDSGIPIERITRPMTAVGASKVRGVIAHMDVPNPDRPGSFGGKEGHTDPGPTFPWTEVLDKAARYAAGSPPLPDTGPGSQPGPTGRDRQYLESHRWDTGYRIGRDFVSPWATIGGSRPTYGPGSIAISVALFGYPVSRVFVDEGRKPHLVVQYFERARMEKWPDGRVTLGRIGAELSDTLRAYLPPDTFRPEGD